MFDGFEVLVFFDEFAGKIKFVFIEFLFQQTAIAAQSVRNQLSFHFADSGFDFPL